METHTAVLMQGSGTFSIEAVLNSTSDREKKVRTKGALILLLFTKHDK
jgi:aspartate aminotransferase-like enzyme